MKKILIILVLFSSFFFYSNIGYSKQYVKLPSDVSSGDKYTKSLTGNYYKDYGFQVVDKKDGHPVRAGKKSIRFEVRSGDCGTDKDGEWDDCKNDRERHELSGKNFKDGEWWYAWSIFVPEDHFHINPSTLLLGQFHQKAGHVIWMFKNGKKEEGYYIENQIKKGVYKKSKLLSKDDMRDKWNDILVNMKWTHKDNGFFKIWINNELTYDYAGPTKTKGKKPYFKFGIYRAWLSKWVKAKNKNEVPTQVIYFDEIRKGKKKEDVVGNLPTLK